MKKMVTGILLCLFVAIVHGQELNFNFVVRKKPVKCGNTVAVFNSIKSIFDENITWFSQNELTDNITTVALFENKKTGTWTLLEFDNNSTCVLASGENKK
jgi:hypothetical protein